LLKFRYTMTMPRVEASQLEASLTKNCKECEEN
jgi:hypothetical protein